MFSLRRRLVVATALACIVLFAGAGALLYTALRAMLIREFEQAMYARAQAIVALVEWDGSGIKIEADADPSVLTERFEVTDLTGRALFQSAGLNAPGRLRKVGYPFIPRVDDEHPDAKPPAMGITLWRDATPLDRELRQVGGLIALTFLTATMAALVLMAALVRIGLRPLGELAGRIAGSSPGESLEVAAAPSEVAPIVERLNELQDRVRSALERERAFSADVAHELRTPVGGLEAALDVAASRPRSAEEYREVIERCAPAVRRMHRMIDTLLLLARAEARQLATRPERVRLAEFVEDCWSTFVGQVNERGTHVSLAIDLSIAVTADRALLAIVLNNLLDNAVSHGDAGGEIRITADQDAQSVTLEIANTGCVLTPEQANQACGRFWRGDEARGGAGEHAGLGLSVCQRIAQVLGGVVNVKVAPGGVFVASLRLPAKP